MTGTPNRLDDPCEECRNRHLKCDDNRPKCSNCERTGQKCCRTKGLRKFRDGSSAHYEKQFSKDQVWLGFSKNAKIQIVDQTAELENFYSIDEPESLPEIPQSTQRPARNVNSSSSLQQVARSAAASQSPSRRSTATSDTITRSPVGVHRASFDNILTFPGHKRRRTDDSTTPTAEPLQFVPVHLPPIPQEFPKSILTGDSVSSSSTGFQVPFFNYASPTEANETRRIEAEYRKIADTEAAAIPAEPLLSPARWKRDFRWPNQYTTQQCMCMFRYYIDHLGPWFDVGDPTRQFTTVVPHRARRCPPLLNAMFSAAALHLRYMHQVTHPKKRTISYGGYELPNLDSVSTLKYYQATISYLRVLCTNEEYSRDEDLLAATVILRFYEELEGSISGSSTGLLSRPFQLFIAAQAKPALAAHVRFEEYDFRQPGAFADIRHLAEPYLKGYQHASFRIALRQECQRALLAREEVQLPLQAWTLLEGFDEAEDLVWTDRHLFHYANVLQFCFSHRGTGKSKAQCWQELRDFENRWDEARPLSFSHYLKKEANREQGEVFPQIWYVNEVNSSGMLYYHFARILLTVYNPNLHRIGPGSQAAMRRVSAEVRDIVIQLCGVAMSTVQAQPVMVQAYIAITMFGEHFTDRIEQEALIGVLDELEKKHGWPVNKDAEALKKDWGW